MDPSGRRAALPLSLSLPQFWRLCTCDRQTNGASRHETQRWSLSPSSSSSPRRSHGGVDRGRRRCRAVRSDDERSIDTRRTTSIEAVAARASRRCISCRRPELRRGEPFLVTGASNLRSDCLLGRMPAWSVGNAAQLSHHCHRAAPLRGVFQAEAGWELRESAHQLGGGGDGPLFDLGASATK
jgi:hypothetical protein